MTSGTALVIWTDGGGRELGRREAYCSGLEVAGQSRPGYWPSRSFVCPHCGQLWARETWHHAYHYRRMDLPEWIVVSRPCRWHGDGTLLDDYPLETCSPSILKRELELLLQQYDRIPHDNVVA